MKRTKILMTMLLFALSLGSGFAQQTRVNVLLNYNPTTFNYGADNDQLKDFKKDVWGLQAGLGLQRDLSSNFTMISELYFIMKGGRLLADNPLTGLDTKTRLYVLELPLLARLHMGDIYLNAGPAIAYNLGGRVKTKGTETIPTEVYNLSFDGSPGSYSRWEAGLQFGGGYGFDVKNTRVTLDLRYSYGLTDIYNGGERYNRALNLNIFLSRAK